MLSTGLFLLFVVRCSLQRQATIPPSGILNIRCQRTTNNEQRTTNNEQRTTNNEQRTTNNEQRT
ncbi:MAG: hypothetical protein ACJ8FY_14305, partial [Gemmataceae bacterium]